MSYSGLEIVPGSASGRLLSSNLELSFWGGVNSETGEIIDRHHPLSGQNLGDTVLAIPGGRGSCSGSGVILELLLNGKGPKGLIFSRPEIILTLGVVVAKQVFGKSIPVVQVSEQDFGALSNRCSVRICGRHIFWDDHAVSGDIEPFGEPETSPTASIELSDLDTALLDGKYGEAPATAMRIVLEMSRLMGVLELINISQVHIDGCVYTGPGSLALAERLRDFGGKVAVPTSLNSISVDQKRWKAQGIEPTFGTAADRLASAYTSMGAKPTFTCAPYQLDTAPKRGDQIAWAESNAVVYANSVLGAKTMKYPDYLDIAIALTGRAPFGGLHIAENRMAELCINVQDVLAATISSDLLYPALGYCVGRLSGSRIPAIFGIGTRYPSKDDLKAFSAAFATVSSAPMFHMVGVTPEATSLNAITAASDVIPQIALGSKDVYTCLGELNTAGEDEVVSLVSLGNPHFSFAEMRRLAELCRGRLKRPSVALVVCCGRSTYGLASQAGLVAELEHFGAQLIEDTCWCMIGDPIIPKHGGAIMTNSAKYAHYGPGLTGKRFRFGSLQECVEASCSTYIAEGDHSSK